MANDKTPEKATMQCARAISAHEAVRKPPAEAISDEALIASIATHDKNAMHALFIRYPVQVFRFLAHLLGDAAAAEDLVSETFLKSGATPLNSSRAPKRRPGS